MPRYFRKLGRDRDSRVILGKRNPVTAGSGSPKVSTSQSSSFSCVSLLNCWAPLTVRLVPRRAARSMRARRPRLDRYQPKSCGFTSAVLLCFDDRFGSGLVGRQLGEL